MWLLPPSVDTSVNKGDRGGAASHTEGCASRSVFALNQYGTRVMTDLG